MPATSATDDPTGHLQPPILSSFLQLPRELRDEIYNYYFQANDNFTYDFATNKLKQADGLSIPLSLTLVCRQIHEEVQGLALTLNTIAFTTSFDETTQESAGLYHASLIITEDRKLVLVNDLAPQLLSTDTAQVVAKLYPQFAPILNDWQSEERISHFRAAKTTWGEPPSIWRDFVNLVLSLIAQDPRFLELSHIASRRYSGYNGDQALKLVGAGTQPWLVPPVTELNEMVKMTQLELRLPCYSPTTRYAYSAASSAIRFLQSISRRTLAAIRNIHVSEDRECVASPQCHSRGFISYCQKNPKFRITHTVNLWKNAFPVSYSRKHTYMRGPPRTSVDLDRDRLPARGITKSIGTWLMEASALSSLKMPSSCYTLVLDGSPNIEHTSEVFRIVQRDIAWQSALDTCYARRLLPESSWQDRCCRKGYIYEGLPDVVRSLSTSSPLIRTNFDPGLPVDIEELLEEHQGWSLEEWEERWAEHEPREFQTKAPLPLWQILRWQYAVL